MCYCFDSMHGISCFEVKENAEKYRDDLSKDIPGGVVTQYTFDEARDIAKSKPPTVGLFLQDDMNNIKIHFVR